jgi:5-(aminomethyl)-3-furanmethanol phosphate kinase
MNSLVVVKVGGSLALYPEKLRTLCTRLTKLSKKHKLIIVPGGGEFADVVRSLCTRFSLSCGVSHKMAILGMDQYGLLLSDLIPNSVVVSKLEEIKCIFKMGKLPVFLPYNLLLNDDQLENSWNVTSDTIALYIAIKLRTNKVLLITDVDGIFSDDPKTHPEARFIERLSAYELLAMNKRTAVDETLPKLLIKSHITCVVVNGLFPERVEAILDNQPTVYTLIVS